MHTCVNSQVRMVGWVLWVKWVDAWMDGWQTCVDARVQVFTRKPDTHYVFMYTERKNLHTDANRHILYAA